MNARFHLASLLNKQDKPHKRESFLDKNETQRIFGKQISNQSAILKEPDRKLHSKSINPVRQQLVEKRFKELISKRTEDKTDKSVNVQCASQYEPEIIHFLINKQHGMDAGYMKNQKDINDKNRATLIDWLTDAHLKFKLLPQTLYKTVHIVDRYAQNNQISKSRLQLLGIAALFMSSKHEEIYPPQPKTFVALAQRAYTSQQVVQMEGKILKDLNFDLTFNTSDWFLERLINEHTLTEKEANMCRYLLELTLLEIKYLEYNSQLLAMSTLYLMTFLLKKQLKLNFQQLKLKDTTVKQCAKEILQSLQNISKSSYQITRKKYSSSLYNEVSRIVVQPVEL